LSLVPEEEDIFNLYLLIIWNGIMTFRRTTEWNGIILSWTREKWLSLIAEHIPTNVKSMLASPYPPMSARLKLLPQLNTTDGAVFLWCTEQNGRQDLAEKKLYVYIGSASMYPGGLDFRKYHMLSPLTTPHDEALKAKIRKLDLNSEGEFKILLTIPFENGVYNNVMDVRATLVLARLVLMIWLGAVDERSKPKIKTLVPWELKHIEYLGLANDNPLMTDLNRRG
jgi:hypothetical protein